MPPRAVAPLESHLGYWLRMVSNAVSRNFAREVEAEGVTVAEWAFMRVLYDSDGLAPTALADRMGMTKGAITKLADRLMVKGLLGRMANPDDRRAQTLALTQSGRSLVPRLATLADENDAAFFAGLKPRDRIDLDRILKRIVASSKLQGMPTD